MKMMQTQYTHDILEGCYTQDTVQSIAAIDFEFVSM